MSSLQYFRAIIQTVRLARNEVVRYSSGTERWQRWERNTLAAGLAVVNGMMAHGALTSQVVGIVSKPVDKCSYGVLDGSGSSRVELILREYRT